MADSILSVEMRYKLMRLLQESPHCSQRDVARALGISVGRVNYCVKALVRSGLIKVSRFKNSHNKAAYMYLLTPRGIRAKAQITHHFLQIKMAEYEALSSEIEQIRRDASATTPALAQTEGQE